MSGRILVDAEGLTKNFKVKYLFAKKSESVVHAVSDVSLQIYEGEVLSLVGESGCGKSTLGRLLINLLEPTAGTLRFDGADVRKFGKKEMFDFTSKAQIIFQDPYASLDPRMTVFDSIAEPIFTHKKSLSKAQVKGMVRNLLDVVGIRPEYMHRFPYQFSGGQRQRIGIARAIALDPQFIVCDEPVSSLDVSIQSQILNLLRSLQRDKGLTYLFISHDLGVVRYISTRVCIMFLGKICEIGNTEDIYGAPLHPYTKFLIEAVPEADPSRRDKKKNLLQGEIPSPVNPPSGCRFRTRCPLAKPICSEKEPELTNVGGRMVACHFAGKP